MSNDSLASYRPDSADEDGGSSSGSTPSLGTAATSGHSNSCSRPNKIPIPIQSHASEYKFTDAKLWNSHAKNRAVIPGATGPPGTILPQVKTVFPDELVQPLDTSSSPDEHTYILGACFSILDRGDQPITESATRMSLCPNIEDHNAGLTHLNTPGFQSALEVVSTCSDRFGHLLERVVSAVNHTKLNRADAFSHLETLLSSNARGVGTKAQIRAGYDGVENGMDSLLDRYWKATIAANPSAEARRRAYNSNQVTWRALSEFPPDTWLPESSERPDEAGPEGSL